jgi:hypothetical protein
VFPEVSDDEPQAPLHTTAATSAAYFNDNNLVTLYLR